MSNNWDLELLQELQSASDNKILDSAIEDFDGKKVLVLEYKGDADCEDYNISVEHYADDITAISIMFTLVSGLDSAQSENAAKLIPYLNKYLSIGNFALLEEDGFLYYNYSFIVDEDSDRSVIIKCILNALAVAFVTTGEAVAVIQPVLSGEASLEEYMNDNISIIQF